MRFFLGGVNGAGKTTLLQKIKEVRPEFETVKGSQEYMRFLGIEGDYEKLRALPDEVKDQKLSEMLKELFAKYPNLVFDAHYLNLVRGEIKMVTGPWLQDFDAMFLLKVSPETILKRMGADERDRALFPSGLSKEQEFAMLADYIQQYDQEFERLRTEYRIPTKVLDGEKLPEEIAQEFLEFTESLRSN